MHPNFPRAMRKRSRFDVTPAEKETLKKTLSQDAKRKRCEAESVQQQQEQTTLWMGKPHLHEHAGMSIWSLES